MRLHLLTLGLAALVCSCGTGSSNSADNSGGGGPGLPPPASIDGLWSATADGMGSTLTMTLSSRGTVVSGTGTYSTGAIRTGSVAVTGTYRPPSAALTLHFDHGESVTFASTLLSSGQMKGKLTYRTGSVIDVEFVRP